MVYTALSIDDDRLAARRNIAPFIVERAGDSGNVGLRANDFYDDLVELTKQGVDAVAHAPDEWWLQLGAIGTPDDVLAHVEALGAAGATSVSLFPPPFLDVAREQLGRVLTDVIPRR